MANNVDVWKEKRWIVDTGYWNTEYYNQVLTINPWIVRYVKAGLHLRAL